MRKQTKLVAVLSATALLAIGAAMTSFAATGWVDEDGTWVYYDNDGNQATDEWKKSGNDWYYLDEDGYMATNKLIDDNYYVDDAGKMVKNQWEEVSEILDDFDSSDPDATDTVWYYFQNNGKAVENGWKSVNGAWYYFNSYAMQSGWQSDIDEETYYLGEEDDGAMKTGWLYLEADDDDDATSPSDSENWYNFGSNGKMVHSKVDKKINGKYYTFDENGIMLSGWVYTGDWSVKDPVMTSTPVEDGDVTSTASNAEKVTAYKYYGEDEDGSRQAGWLKIQPAKKVNDTDSTYWFYFSSGKAKYSKAAGNEIITVNSKKYAFNTIGQMQAGDKVVSAVASKSDATTNIYYFGASTDGSMKTGKQNVYIDDEGETYSYYFATSGKYKGQAYIGEKDGYLYNEDGRLQKASSDLKYEAVEYGTKTYLVNTSGKIMKASKGKDKIYKDKDDVEYTVNDKGEVK